MLSNWATIIRGTAGFPSSGKEASDPNVSEPHSHAEPVSWPKRRIHGVSRHSENQTLDQIGSRLTYGSRTTSGQPRSETF